MWRQPSGGDGGWRTGYEWRSALACAAIWRTDLAHAQKAWSARVPLPRRPSSSSSSSLWQLAAARRHCLCHVAGISDAIVGGARGIVGARWGAVTLELTIVETVEPLFLIILHSLQHADTCACFCSNDCWSHFMKLCPTYFVGHNLYDNESCFSMATM